MPQRGYLPSPGCFSICSSVSPVRWRAPRARWNISAPIISIDGMAITG